MSSFGITPEPETTPEVATVEETPVAKDPSTLIPENATEDEGPLRTTDQADHLYSYEIDERKKADVTGVYYDDLKRMEAEQHRARLEKREPDYDTMGGIASTPLLRMTERPAEPTS